jgi:hypothetical protein
MNILTTRAAEDRESLERRADAVRERLMHIVEVLGQKRHDVFDMRLQVRRHLVTVAILGGVIALVLGAGVVAVALRLRDAPARLRRERWRALVRGYRHPYRLARRQEGMGERVLAIALTTIAGQLARRAVRLR